MLAGGKQQEGSVNRPHQAEYTHSGQGAAVSLVLTLLMHIPRAHTCLCPREVWAHADLRDVAVPKEQLIYL